MAVLLSDAAIAQLDPYQFMAALGKRVIHPGGLQSTEELFGMIALPQGARILEIGCGVGATAIELARRFDVGLVITDIDERMVLQARQNVTAAGLVQRISVQRADIVALPFQDSFFDLVIIEAVTMFVNRDKAVDEVMRVCKSGGRVVEQEFIWRRTPTREARSIFTGEVCPGIQFDTADDWIALYARHGFRYSSSITGPFRMMSAIGFLRDEGWNSITMLKTLLSRLAFVRKMVWLMRRIFKVRDYLGYIVFSVEKS